MERRQNDMVLSGNHPRHRGAAFKPPSQCSPPRQYTGTKTKKRFIHSSRKWSHTISAFNHWKYVIAWLTVFVVGVFLLAFWKSSILSKGLFGYMVLLPEKAYPRVISVTESLQKSRPNFDYSFEKLSNENYQIKISEKRSQTLHKDSWYERHRVVLQDEDTGCPFVDDFQKTKPNPTCNTIHEVGLHVTPMEKPVMYRLDFINEGAFKQVWQPYFENGEEAPFVLKTTFFNDYTESDLLLDQQDALVMERTTASNYVVSMYGYCHFTNLVQQAKGTLSHWIRKNGRHASSLDLLRIADMMAQGVKDMHMFTKTKNGHLLPTIAHADIKGSQFLETSPGEFRLNDFNRGSLLTSKDYEHICPFYLPGVHHKGSTMRSPEEYEDNAPQDDKVDVFSLGSSLYNLLTGDVPFGDLDDAKTAMENIRKGVPLEMLEVSDPSIQAIEKAITMCRQFKAKDRPWSWEVADFIRKELEIQEGKVALK